MRVGLTEESEVVEEEEEVEEVEEVEVEGGGVCRTRRASTPAVSRAKVRMSSLKAIAPGEWRVVSRGKRAPVVVKSYHCTSAQAAAGAGFLQQISGPMLSPVSALCFTCAPSQ